MKLSRLSVLSILLLAGCTANQNTSKTLSFNQAKELISTLPNERNLLKALDLEKEESKNTRSITVTYETDSQVKYDCYSVIRDLSEDISDILFEYKDKALSAIDSVSSFGEYRDFSLVSYEDKVEYITKNKYTFETGAYYMYNNLGEYVPVARCSGSTITVTLKENFVSISAVPTNLLVTDKTILQYNGIDKVDENIFSYYCYIVGNPNTYSSIGFYSYDVASYTSVEVEKNEDEVRYVENYIGLGLEDSRNALTITRFKDDVVTSNCYYCYEESQKVVDEQFPELGKDLNRMLFTTQVNDGTNAGLCLFPSHDIYSISGTMVDGWTSMDFVDDCYTNQDYSLGFLGCMPYSIKTGQATYNLNQFIGKTGLYPTASLFYRDQQTGLIMPERISFSYLNGNFSNENVYDSFLGRLEQVDLSIIDSDKEAFNTLLKNSTVHELSFEKNEDFTTDKEVLTSWLSEGFYTIYNQTKIENKM